MSNLTPDEEEVRRAAIEGRLPYDRRVPPLPDMDTAPAPESNGRRVLKRADLAHTVTAKGEWYEVPGTGGGFYVFGVSDADYRLLLKWSLRFRSADPNAGDADYSRAALVNQVIACCRDGETLQSNPVFEQADAEYVSKYLGYAVIEEIVQISARLSGKDEILGAGVRRFFEPIRNALRISSSMCATCEDCPPGFPERLTRLKSLVSRALSRGSLDSGILSDLRDLGEG